MNYHVDYSFHIQIQSLSITLNTSTSISWQPSGWRFKQMNAAGTCDGANVEADSELKSALLLFGSKKKLWRKRRKDKPKAFLHLNYHHFSPTELERNSRPSKLFSGCGVCMFSAGALAPPTVRRQGSEGAYAVQRRTRSTCRHVFYTV